MTFPSVAVRQAMGLWPAGHGALRSARRLHGVRAAFQALVEHTECLVAALAHAGLFAAARTALAAHINRSVAALVAGASAGAEGEIGFEHVVSKGHGRLLLKKGG
jgi:hypothetical protein